MKLTIYGGRSVRSGGQPGYVAAVQRLREAGAVGASVLLGVDGTLHGERRRARFFARNAGLPLVLLAIGEANALESVLPDLTKLIEDPVVTIERVQVHKPDERQISGPEQIPDHDQAGLSLWQKVMVHTEEQAKCAGRPLHVELVRRLHEAGAAGVTVLRGVRGFYGERGPFADRLLTLRRNVPVHVIAVDTPTNVRRWWPLVSETTRDGGLVTVERVPAAHALTSGQPGELRLAAPDTAQAPGG